MPIVSSSDRASDRQTIIDYLRQRAADGTEYIHSAEIADAIGLSPKQVGAHLRQIPEMVSDLTIEHWAKHHPLPGESALPVNC